MEPKEIEAARRERLEELGRIGPLIVGSLARVGVRCGRPNCRCARGQRHTAYVLTSKVRGRTRTVHVPVDLVEEVRSWVEAHRRLKRLVKEISALSEELVRGHVRARRAARATLPSPRRTRSKRS